MNEQRQQVVADGALTIKAAEEFSGVRRSLLYKRMSSGSLAYCKVGRRRLVPRKALTQMLADGLIGDR